METDAIHWSSGQPFTAPGAASLTRITVLLKLESIVVFGYRKTSSTLYCLLISMDCCSLSIKQMFRKLSNVFFSPVIWLSWYEKNLIVPIRFL